MTLPTREEAHKLIMDMGGVLRIHKIDYMHSFRHYLRVAQNACEIAGYVPHLDAEKAYIMGLLHDYGQAAEAEDGSCFHGYVGYQKLLKLGYDEAARASLVHSFFEDEEIIPERYSSYDAQCIMKCAEELKKRPFDDYDRLIHLADLTALGQKTVTMEKRFEYLAMAYDIDDELLKDKYARALRLKKYFDERCGQDVYKILHIFKSKA